ncbi:WD repeat domain-containing protein [Plectosphaerella plurivora]|uniref:WD repeat domain-containing protein n=1 Tax=Plectosphaerella plurivora TaxID=936078 RepID=A0A9P9AAB7_9PEZI|nr:WD repeat domain-containing protein [Plectosphaerella plurivora]
MTFPNKPLAHLTGSNGPVHAVTYSASPGTYILTGSADRTVRLYNPFPSTSQTLKPSSSINERSTNASSVPEGRLIQSYAAHGYEVLSLAVAPDNERFVSSGGDRAVFLWDVATAQTIRRFGGTAHGHTSRINAVRFAGEGASVVVSGGFDTTVRLWDTKSGGAGGAKPIQVLDEAKDAISAVVVRGPEIVVGSVDGHVRSYDLRTGKCTVDVIGTSVTSLDLTQDGKAMLVGGLDSKLRLMDREQGTCLKTYADEAFKNTELRIQSMLGAREKYVLAGDEVGGGPGRPGEGRVWAWDLMTGKLAATLRVPWGPQGYEPKKKVLGRDGKEKERSNVVSCMAWQTNGWGHHFCVGGSSGVATVFGSP